MFFQNISKKKKISRLYLSKRFFILTLILYLTYFGSKMQFLIFYSVFLELKHKILSKLKFPFLMVFGSLFQNVELKLQKNKMPKSCF